VEVVRDTTFGGSKKARIYISGFEVVSLLSHFFLLFFCLSMVLTINSDCFPKQH
jgi:hypothetical protein